ncbi:ATP-binding cassette domain-containing protein [Actinopolymorpha sp. B11F2]|uniref:ATP-binding cassette domain-containing protein n=1 Tax=Actinopolymorpha sp. B11F2 TaxID=3160862 RepID=UPI0032E38D64
MVAPGRTGPPRTEFGLVPRRIPRETPAVYPELTVRENLEIVRRLRGLTGPWVVDDVLAQLGLVPYAGRRARTLSPGNSQRLGLAKALIHRTDLLILDEPANGLDPAGLQESATCSTISPTATASPSCCPATSSPRSPG